MRVSRRGAFIAMSAAGVLGIAGGLALVVASVLPVKGTLDAALGRCGATVPPAASRATPGPVLHGSFRSAARRREVNFVVSNPPGFVVGSRLPVCLALHGIGTDAEGAIGAGDYPQYIAGAVRDGAAPLALAAADGGNGYWHPHADDDPQSMLVDESLPLLAARGLRTESVAVAGWSMGGYGALLCGLTHRERFKLLVASSPAVFHSFEDAHRVNRGAFDTPVDWRRYDLTARAKEFAGLPVRIAIGAADPFAPAVEALRDKLANPGVVHVDTGCHDNRFWSSVAPGQVRAISMALSL